MKYKLIIVRYGEIALKGKETRKRFENILVSNIKNALSIKNLPNKITKEWGRIYIYTAQIEQCIDVLQRIFGIISISPALQTVSNMDSMSQLAVSILKDKLNPSKNFAIRATRTGQHEYTSQDVAIKIGDEIVKSTNAGVNLTNPDYELFIEIRNNNAYLFTKKIRCTGGMPYETQGKILSLINSREAILAAWYLVRRGCKIVFVITDELQKNILQSFMKNWFIKSDIFTIDSDKNRYEELYKMAIETSCIAIVTDHTIFDKSKETMDDLKQLKKHINLPVLYPLIAMDAEQINEKCKELGLSV